MNAEVFKAVSFLYRICTNKELGRFTTTSLVTVINSYFAGFKYNLLQLNHSDISRNRLFTCSVNISEDIPAAFHKVA